MTPVKKLACCLLLIAGLSAAQAQVPPVAAPDQLALLKSTDPKLAANKKLVFDMYRTIVNAGRYDLAEKFFTKEYIQHNPNVASGRDAAGGVHPQDPPDPPDSGHHRLSGDQHHGRG